MNVREVLCSSVLGNRSLTVRFLGTVTVAKLWHTVAGLYMYGLTISCACHAIQVSVYRWELVTTLDYEWRVIRGRIPYRWTIWVRSDQRFALTSSHIEKFLADSACSIDIFPHTCGWSFGPDA